MPVVFEISIFPQHSGVRGLEEAGRVKACFGGRGHEGGGTRWR